MFVSTCRATRVGMNSDSDLVRIRESMGVGSVGLLTCGCSHGSTYKYTRVTRTRAQLAAVVYRYSNLLRANELACIHHFLRCGVRICTRLRALKGERPLGLTNLVVPDWLMCPQVSTLVAEKPSTNSSRTIKPAKIR